MWVDVPYMGVFSPLCQWVRSQLDLGCWCQVLDLARRSWELVFAPTMPPTRLLWKLWCRRPAYRWAWVEVVLENAFFPSTVAFARKTHMIHMICIWFWKPFTISELNANHGSRESSVCSWTWCKLRQKRGKQSHCLQGIGIHVMPLVQASCSEHVNWPSQLVAYAIGPRWFKGFGGCGMLHFFCATPLLQVAVATNPTHYGNPETGCESDEQAVRVQGLSGDFCSPKCNSQGSCPSDVPKGDSATPQCALRTTTGDKYCALICQSDSDCGIWAAWRCVGFPVIANMKNPQFGCWRLAWCYCNDIMIV